MLGAAARRTDVMGVSGLTVQVSGLSHLWWCTEPYDLMYLQVAIASRRTATEVQLVSSA